MFLLLTLNEYMIAGLFIILLMENVFSHFSHFLNTKYLNLFHATTSIPSESNFFRIEVIFRCAKNSILRLFLLRLFYIHIACGLEFVPDFAFQEYQVNNH